MQKDTFGLRFYPTAKDRREMQDRKQTEKEEKQIVLYIPSLCHIFPHPSEVIVSKKDDLVREVEVNLSQLFIGATCEEELLEDSEYLLIFEGIIQT